MQKKKNKKKNKNFFFLLSGKTKVWPIPRANVQNLSFYILRDKLERFALLP
jgi:hypothetical protein